MLRALSALADSGVLLATVNYDDVLERATGLWPVTWCQPAKVEHVLRGRSRAILHMHGHWDQPESVVLGVRSYEDVVRDDHAREVLRSLRMARTFVFVGHGTGLGDPNWGSFLRWTERAFRGSEYRHFRLIHEDEIARVQAEHPSDQRIFALSYGKTHADLGPFLTSLVPTSRSIVPVQPIASDDPPAPTRWVILRIHVAEQRYNSISWEEACGLIEDPEPRCLDFSYPIKDQADISPRSWRAIARGLDQLVADARAASGPSSYLILGRAPLPVFAYLGSLMSTHFGPCRFANKFNGKWEFYDSPARCPPGGRDDLNVCAPGLGYDRGGRIALSIQASNEYTDHEPSIVRLLEAERVRYLGTYKIHNDKSSHREVPLTPSDLPVYLEHVERALQWRSAEVPAGRGLVVALAGPAWLAYWIGRRFNPNLFQGRIDFPHFVEGGYVRALSNPMRKAPWLAGKARLLVMNAEPVNLVRTRASKSFDTIQSTLERELGIDGPFELRYRGAARLREFMRDVETFEPDILHLHLHGREEGGRPLCCGS